MSLNDVIRYYETHQWYYSHFWSPVSLHYGLWYPGTKSLAEAIDNTDTLLIEKLAIGPEDEVLDAGCGVGGTSIRIAETARCRVTGITLSPRQLRIALALASRSTAASRVRFAVMDYCHTTFDAGAFSAVVAVESMCHAEHKATFVGEAHRLIRPGGRIAIIDYFLTARTRTVDENRLLSAWMKGWAIPNVLSIGDFGRMLEEAGYHNVRFVDLRELIWPSVDRVYRLGLLSWPLGLLRHALGRGAKSVSCRYQKHIFQRNVATYGLFLARRPQNSTHRPTP